MSGTLIHEEPYVPPHRCTPPLRPLGTGSRWVCECRNEFLVVGISLDPDGRYPSSKWRCIGKYEGEIHERLPAIPAAPAPGFKRRFWARYRR